MSEGPLPLHKRKNTHLYSGPFEEFAAETLTTTGDLLVAAPNDELASIIVNAIRGRASSGFNRVESYSGDQTDVPYQPDTFDAAVQYNPGRGILQRHNPLYEMVAVVRKRGSIVYRAPNYIAQSTAASVEELQILGWDDHENPTIAAEMDVTVAGDPRDEEHTGSNETTLADFPQ